MPEKALVPWAFVVSGWRDPSRPVRAWDLPSSLHKCCPRWRQRPAVTVDGPDTEHSLLGEFRKLLIFCNKIAILIV